MNRKELENHYKEVLIKYNVSSMDGIHIFSCCYTDIFLELASKNLLEDFLKSMPDNVLNYFKIVRELINPLCIEIIEKSRAKRLIKDD